MKLFESLDGLYCPATPEKLAACVIIPAPFGVTWHVAFPFESVVAEQPVPPSVKLIDCPAKAAGGVTDESTSNAVSVVAVPAMPAVRLEFSVRKVE